MTEEIEALVKGSLLPNHSHEAVADFVLEYRQTLQEIFENYR